jgi:hypothetical protein
VELNPVNANATARASIVSISLMEPAIPTSNRQISAVTTLMRIASRPAQI